MKQNLFNIRTTEPTHSHTYNLQTGPISTKAHPIDKQPAHVQNTESIHNKSSFRFRQDCSSEPIWLTTVTRKLHGRCTPCPSNCWSARIEPRLRFFEVSGLLLPMVHRMAMTACVDDDGDGDGVRFWGWRRDSFGSDVRMFWVYLGLIWLYVIMNLIF